MRVILIRGCVSWNSKKSDEFPVSSGVRQGGVLSPILFTVYIGLSLRGRVLVATVTSTSLVPFVMQMTWHPPSTLRLMLNTCSSFATSHNLIFNDLFGSPVLLKPFQPAFFNSRDIQVTNSVVISFILAFQIMKTFVCGNILPVKLIAYYIRSLAVALVLRPSLSLTFAYLFMDPVYSPCIKIFRDF